MAGEHSRVRTVSYQADLAARESEIDTTTGVVTSLEVVHARQQ